MKTVKRVLWPERLRQVPRQFSWVDQALVRCGLIDRCDARAASLYLFLVTVCDAQGMSYYGAATLAPRLRLSPDDLDAARTQLIELELIAYQPPLYQVLALPGSAPQMASGAPPHTPPSVPLRMATPTPARDTSGPVSIAHLLERMKQRNA